MTLSSVPFLMFLAVSAVLYYVLPWKMRNVFLLLASFAFYAFSAPQYLPLIILTAAGSYLLARVVDGQENRKARKALTVVGIVALVAVLCLFKYAAAPLGALVKDIPVLGILARETNAGFALIMPVGISFYTFAIIGYILDVFNKKIKAEKNIVDYALFVSFFPCILSGPINRAGEMLPQFKEEHTWSYENTVDGLQRFLWGALKKVVIADGVSLIVNGVWSSLNEYHGLTIAVTMILYMIQIYCDFSGYSDMAVGTAKIFGFTVRENFAAPFTATNMSGLWKRWHMSLTTWFNDYIFTPLVWSRWANKLFFGKKRDEHKPHFALNIFIIFLLSGAWHGSGVTYVLWGVANGLLRLGEELAHRIKAPKKRKNQTSVEIWIKRVCVFLLFALTHILFRAPSLADASLFFGNMFSDLSLVVTGKQLWYLISAGISSNKLHYIFYLGSMLPALALLVWGDAYVGRTGNLNPLVALKGKKRWIVYWFMGLACALFYIMILTANNGTVQFIYQGY